MEDSTHTTEDDVVPTGGDDVSSILNTLRETREEIIENVDPLFVPVPGYKEQLWMRCMPFGISNQEKRFSEQARQRRKAKPELLNGSCDTIIESTEELMLLPDRCKGEIGDKGVNLIPIDDELPVKWDNRLATLFEIPGASQMNASRQVVKAMFPTEQSILAVAARIGEWLQGDVEPDVAEQALGNSSSTS